MAQASTTTMAMPSEALVHSPTAAITTDAVLEMQEYDRIVKFRDSILSGHHPRIKVPVPPTSKSASIQQVAQKSLVGAISPLPKSQSQSAFASTNMQSFKANSQQTAAANSHAVPSAPAASRPLTSSTQIDPLLLTKSDQLVKAELHLQRQRLERALRDEVDAQRVANKNAEQASDFDLSDILAKALTLVQATAPPLTDVDMAANASVSSDSFDENTFYSSQHDTPEPSPQPQAATATAQVHTRDAASTQTRPNASEPKNIPSQDHALVPSPFLSRAEGHQSVPGTQKSGNAAPLVSQSQSQSQVVIDTTNANDSRYSPTYDVVIPGLGQRLGADEAHAQVISSNGSGSTSRSGDSGNADLERRAADYGSLQTLHPPPHSQQYGFGEPLIRAHDLSPYAPQPSHVSPLAIARQQPIPEPEISILPGPPAPIAALRQEHGNGTSPESSPQGEKGNKKKNKKKNKRKAGETRSADRPVSPYIKLEPRSPSPLTSPQFARPQKRQRPLNQPQHELSYDDSRGAQPIQVIHDDPLPRPQREYERVYDPYPHEVRYSVAPGSQRAEGGRRPEEPAQYIRGAHSPAYISQPALGDIRPMRSATYSLAEPIFREAPAYQRDGRMSVRPVADRARSRSPIMVDTRPPVMAPPRPPTRIFRDEFGREYLEPPRPPPSARYSVAPSARLAEPEVIYEQTPVRAATRIPGPETFERDGIIYRRASPVPSARRVVTQPEYGGSEFRDYRQRDYSVRPVATPSANQEFVQYRSETRPQQDMVSDLGMRSVTARPTEHVRYEYPPRVASVRPEVPMREYAASAHPDAMREAPIPVYREYSARVPVEQGLPHREYSVRPVERYYDNRPVIREDEIQYIDQPRTVQREIIYQDGRRGVYR